MSELFDTVDIIFSDIADLIPLLTTRQGGKDAFWTQ